MRHFRTEMRDPRTLKPNAGNARSHPKKQVRQIANSILKFDFIGHAVIDGEGNILAGHARVEAAILAGLAFVPCLIVDHLTEAQKRAFVLADNKLTLNATWDEEKLSIALSEILEIDVNFDLSLTGFDAHEVDRLSVEFAPEDQTNSPKDDKLPEIEADEPAVTREGDIWLCRGHRLICGNALHREVYESLLGAEPAQMVITDPPFNVPIQGHAGGSGKIKQREFAMAAGEMSAVEFQAFLLAAFRLLVAFSMNGSIHFVFMDWRHLAEITAAGAQAYSELKNLIVWAKDNGGMGTFYRSRHELVFPFKNGTAPHINNFELGQHGRYRTNVWEYRGLNTGGKDRQEELKLHPTVKPVKMLADAMLDCSKKGGIVLDAFGGSGSTMIAAEKTGRCARLIELDPIYVDCSIRRWQAYTGEDAIHAETGETFNERTAAFERARLIASVVTIPYPDRPNIRRVNFGMGGQP
ncbi:DNA methyltransferase [Mesorhizobium sp. M1348]|uniref:site-specific DNA-methyltransferase n=1 Tax=unclassified Mesorhizobium TaxID=325217 RepID=UPI00333719F3